MFPIEVKEFMKSLFSNKFSKLIFFILLIFGVFFIFCYTAQKVKNQIFKPKNQTIDKVELPKKNLYSKYENYYYFEDYYII